MEIDKCEQIAEKIIRYSRYLKDVSENNTLSTSSVRDILKEDKDTELFLYLHLSESLKNKLLERIETMKLEFKASCGEIITDEQVEEILSELGNMDKFVPSLII